MVESTLAGSEVARLQVMDAEDPNVSFDWASGRGDTHGDHSSKSPRMGQFVSLQD